MNKYILGAFVIPMFVHAAPLLAATTADVAARRLELFEREATHPFPSSVCKNPVKVSDSCISGELSQALAFLYLDRSADDLAKGNMLLADAVQRIPELQGFGDADGLRHLYQDEFHFGIGVQLYRLAAPFRADGPYHGRIEPRTSEAMTRLFYDWARTSCPIKDADPRSVWNIYGSENHEPMDNGACWGAADVLSREPAFRGLPYGDHSTATQLESQVRDP